MIRGRLALEIALLTTSTLSPATGLVAQTVATRTSAEHVEFGGRVHLQYNTSSADGTIGSEFLLRRARLWGAARINDWIDGAAQVDFSEGQVSARYAFVRLSFDPAFQVSFGQMKRSFDLFELTSSSQILVIERDGGIRDAGTCTGVGGLCSYTRFSEQLEFSAPDVGVLVAGDVASGRLAYQATFSNGTGANAREVNDTKSASARLEWHAPHEVKLGVNAGVHDFPNPVTGVDAYAPAVALDVEVGDFDQGFHLQAGILTGENWKNLDDAGDGSRFMAAQGIATYRIPTPGHHRILGVEPLARLSWGDPDTGMATDGGFLMTPGIVLHFEGRNKMAANLDTWHPQSGDTAWGLKVQTYLYF